MSLDFEATRTVTFEETDYGEKIAANIDRYISTLTLIYSKYPAYLKAEEKEQAALLARHVMSLTEAEMMRLTIREGFHHICETLYYK